MPDCFFFLGSSKSKLKCQKDPQTPLLIIKDSDYGTAADAGDDELHNPTAAMALILTSWLDGRRLRYLILVLFSPLLVPIICASFPILIAAEVCFRIYRRHRLKSVPPAPRPPRVDDVEGGGQVKTDFSLLDRYLDDQLGLALEILHDCGGDLGYNYDDLEGFDRNRSNLLF